MLGALIFYLIKTTILYHTLNYTMKTMLLTMDLLTKLIDLKDTPDSLLLGLIGLLLIGVIHAVYVVRNVHMNAKQPNDLQFQNGTTPSVRQFAYHANSLMARCVNRAKRTIFSLFLIKKQTSGKPKTE